MEFLRRNNRGTRAFTLAEIVVTMGLAIMLLASLGSLVVHLSRSTSSLYGYATIGAKDRVALEVIGRDIREAEAFTNLNATNISLLLTGQVVHLSFNPVDRRLYRTTAQTNQVLFPHCKELQFSFYSRNPVATSFESHIPSTSNCEIVQLKWASEISSSGTRASSSHVVRFLNRKP